MHSPRVASSAWRVLVSFQSSLDNDGLTRISAVTVLVALVAPFFMYDVRASIHPVLHHNSILSSPQKQRHF